MPERIAQIPRLVPTETTEDMSYSPLSLQQHHCYFVILQSGPEKICQKKKCQKGKGAIIWSSMLQLSDLFPDENMLKFEGSTSTNVVSFFI